MLWLLTIPGALALIIVILLLRAAAFRPAVIEPVEIEEAGVDAVQAASRLARMISCMTVSSRDASLVDSGEFEKFRGLLPELYPNVHNACEMENIGPSGILYKLRGRSDAAPVILMSHYDVVPADEPAWDKPAFEGILENGVLWGRGALDTKGTLCGIMEAAESLIGTGFVPENDLYFAFSGDEEIAGETAPAMVDEFLRRGVNPSMVLDEGGAVVEGVFPGVTKPIALIGVAEKGMMDVELSITGRGGHAAYPPPHTPVGVLSRAVTRVENKPFKTKLTPPVAAMFDILGRHSTFVYRLVFANIRIFLPILGAMFRKRGGELNAMLRTTCAFTMMEGGNASNVIPPAAKVTANLRLIGGETMESALERLKSLADDPDVVFSVIHGSDPSRVSSTDGGMWDTLAGAISQTWPGTLVSPYLMFACSDSRHYCRISDRVYRFSAMALTHEERAAVHGHNERIAVENLAGTIQFYTRLIRRC